MDLATLDVRAFAAKGAEIELYDPVTRKPLGIHWKIIGRDADEYQTWIFQRAEEKAAEHQARSRRRSAPQNDYMTAEQIYADQVEEAAFCSRGWREVTDKKTGDSKPTITLRGEELVFSTERASETLFEFPWILEQVMAGVVNRGVFMPASATN